MMNIKAEVQEWYFSGQLFKRFHYEKAKKKEWTLVVWRRQCSRQCNIIKKAKMVLIGIKLCKNPYEKSVE
jgi:hypothetical protein